MTISIGNMTTAQLERALTLRKQIEELETEVGNGTVTALPAPVLAPVVELAAPRKRQMSEEARKKISRAQTKRWKKERAEKAARLAVAAGKAVAPAQPQPALPLAAAKA